MSKKIEKKLPAPEALGRLRLLILDVDGVMTDGTITYDSRGVELKSFSVKDGAGLDLWRRAGLSSGIITGR
ncbi:MAG: phenylphosphate carboxylase subunit delta, partial [Planctomycetota bacterium]|nr:phenylphosphate carboxylase subunit delta [Planctomycetota bacterium]